MDRGSLRFALWVGTCLGCGSGTGADAGSPTGADDGSTEGLDDGSVDDGDDDGGDGNDGGSADDGSADDGPDPIDPMLPPGSCDLDEPAFCETFDEASPGGRGADIDETRWSFSRYGHPEASSFFLRGPLYTQNDRLFPASFCGEPFEDLFPGDDVRVCEGVGVDGRPTMQLQEVMDDEGDFGFNSMRIRQPFDFTDRTGKIVWDVDAKTNPLNVGHGWWIELWITEDPVPMPYHEAPTVAAFPRSGVGFAFQFGGDCPASETEWSNALETVTVTADHQILHSIPFWEFSSDYEARCFSVADQMPNHLELHVSQDRAELWASDHDDPGSFRLRSVVEGLDLPFSKGYVHFQHAAYNAPKDGNVTGSQTFRWDNIGFDGPTYPTPRAYDVPDNTELDGYGRVLTAYHLMAGQTQSFTLAAVDLGEALRATFNFDIFAARDQALEYRFNGGPWHEFIVQTADGHEGTGMRGFSVEVPLSELVDGDNTLDVRMPMEGLVFEEMIGNIDLTIEAP
jgi:hypothetical protein